MGLDVLFLAGCGSAGWRIAGEQTAQACDIAIVLGQRAAEKMSALIVGDEIKIIGLRRGERRAQRSLAGISDGPRGQASMLVRVVWRINAQIFGANVAFRGCPDISRAYCTVGSHCSGTPKSQTIVEDSRHQRTLVRIWRFTFDERRQTDHLRRRQASRRPAARPDGLSRSHVARKSWVIRFTT